MKTTRIAAVLSAYLCVLQFSVADVLILKNGDKIEGKVVREDAENVVIEVMVTETIRDEKKVPKADIELVRRETRENKDLLKVEKLLPSPDLLNEEEYAQRIAIAEEFVSKYSESRQAVAAKTILEKLKSELELIRKGGFIFGGKMIAEEDYEPNAYEYDVAISEKEIKGVVAKGDFLVALRLFEDYEERFKQPASYPDMKTLMLKVLTVYGRSLTENLEGVEERLEARENGLMQMSGEDRIDSKKAIADKDELIEARFRREKEAGETWVTPDPYHKESLAAASKEVESTVERLQKSPEVNLLQQPLAETYRLFWGKLGTDSEEEKKKTVDDLKKSGLSDHYVEMLEQRAGM